MSHDTTLYTLYTTIRDSLPYEYATQYINGKDTNHSILINREDLERTIYITANESNDDILDVALYEDDDPIEISQWDTDDPSLNLSDLITYIKKTI